MENLISFTEKIKKTEEAPLILIGTFFVNALVLSPFRNPSSMPYMKLKIGLLFILAVCLSYFTIGKENPLIAPFLKIAGVLTIAALTLEQILYEI